MLPQSQKEIDIQVEKNGLKFGIAGQKETWRETEEVEPYDHKYVARFITIMQFIV